MQILLVVIFIAFVVLGVPISFALGFVSFAGIAALPIIPNSVVFTKMFNGLNSFTLLAVPLFILAANLMNEGAISDRLIDVCSACVGHVRGGLAHANILVSMIFAGISGSSQADTAGVGKILIPAMEKQGYDKQTAVGVTAASSTLGSIIPPSITMVVFAGIANVGTGALFMTGLIPFSSYIFPALAGIVLISVREENGLKTALLVYAATSLLALLIIPDREAVMMYIMLLGYYPLAKPWIERLARPLSILFKLLLFNIVVVAFYYVMLFVFGVPDMLEGWGDFGRYTVAVILVIVNFTLFMYDYLLTQALHIYRGWFRPKILRKII